MKKEKNRLVHENIPKLIKEMGIPASIGFFFNTMYNVVDTFYGGLVSTEALAALSLSFPVFFIIIALSSGLSTGVTALISNCLGANKIKEARKLAIQSISLTVLLSIIITFIGLYSSPYLFTLLGASGNYLSLSLEYMNVIFYGTVFFLVIYTFNAILNSIGDTKTFRNFLIFGFFLNLLLDPWFMFGWFGFPALGIAGVAWATVIIQAIGCIYLGIKVSKTHLLSDHKLHNFIPEKKAIKEISKQGIPASLNMFTIGIGIFIITYFISIFGSAAVAAYGIATRVEQIFLLPAIGLTIATLTLVGTNNGAKKFSRVSETIKVATKYGLLIMTLGTVLIFIFANQFMDIFTNDKEVISIGANYLRIAAFITWAYAILFINVSALQGMKKPMYALWIGLFRQIIAPIIVFWILVNQFNLGIYGIWIGIFVITWTAAIITLFYSRHVLNKLNKK